MIFCGWIFRRPTFAACSSSDSSTGRVRPELPDSPKPRASRVFGRRRSAGRDSSPRQFPRMCNSPSPWTSRLTFACSDLRSRCRSSRASRSAARPRCKRRGLVLCPRSSPERVAAVKARAGSRCAMRSSSCNFPSPWSCSSPAASSSGASRTRATRSVRALMPTECCRCVSILARSDTSHCASRGSIATSSDA